MSDAVLKYGEPENYVNRELSWLEFNYRILGEARDKTTPLFERLKFLSITASNLDEFFMVRVASLKDMVHANYTKRDIAGMTAQEQLDAIDVKTHELVENQYRTYNRMLLPLLKQHGLRVVTEHEKLTKEEAVYVDRYFEESVYPVLTPMAVDSSRPFPLIHNKSLNIAALVRKKKGDGELEFAMVCVPGGLPRVVELPCQEVAFGGKNDVFALQECVYLFHENTPYRSKIVCQTGVLTPVQHTIHGIGMLVNRKFYPSSRKPACRRASSTRR